MPPDLEALKRIQTEFDKQKQKYAPARESAFSKLRRQQRNENNVKKGKFFVKWILPIIALLLTVVAVFANENYIDEPNRYHAMGWCVFFTDDNFHGSLVDQFRSYIRDACAFGYVEGYRRGYEAGLKKVGQ